MSRPVRWNVLDLFSGIGGFSLGLERAGMATVGFCEVDPWCRRILALRWPEVPIYPDVRTLDGTQFRDTVDVIAGGFPCQDVSGAGKQAGISAARSGLWSEYARIIAEVRPRFALIENVVRLLTGGGGQWFGRVLKDLAAVGYDAEWHCIPASAIGALHHRDRLWILAYPGDLPGMDRPLAADISLAGKGYWGSVSVGNRLEKYRFKHPGVRSDHRVDDGLSGGMDGFGNRVNGLGNAIVPQIAELLGAALIRREAAWAR